MPAPRRPGAVGKFVLGSDRAEAGSSMSASKKWAAQPDLFSVPHARWSDPQTSRQAAESISLTAVSQTQERILTVFKFHGHLSDEQLEQHFETYWPGTASPQGVRSRRGELVRKGLVLDSGRRGTTKYGRGCIVWQVAS